jgi:uncharacterized protein with FMN-binding domain
MRYFIISILGLFVLSGITGCNDSSYLKKIPVSEPDLSSIPNGTYSGSNTLKLPFGSMVAFPSAEVAVVISNHRYYSIEITGMMKPIARKSIRPFMDRIIQEQKLNIDSVSGASYTKKTVQKAIENALIKK